MSFLDAVFTFLNYRRSKKNLRGRAPLYTDVTSKVALVSHPKGFKMFKI